MVTRPPVRDLASFQKDAPGAKTYMNERDAPVLESGGNVDCRRTEGRGIIYDPVKVDVHQARRPYQARQHRHDGAGGLWPYVGGDELQLPGDGCKTYNVLIVNMDGINAGVKLLGSPGYPTIIEDFKNTLAMQATYAPDIWVSSHAGQFNLHKVYKRRI